jgi:hypothetical protein
VPKYNGFLTVPALGAFRRQVQKALNTDATIKAEKNRVEGKYRYNSLSDYINLLYPWDIKDIELWQSALFNAMVNGYDFDFSKKQLSENEMKAYVHVEQVFEYYKQVPKADEPLEVSSTKDLLLFFESAGELVRPAKIELDTDGNNMVTAWSIGKSIDELYKEKVEQIEKEVEGLEARCYSNLDNEALNLLAVNLKEVIYLYKYKNKVFKDNSPYQERIEHQFSDSANRLEKLLYDVVMQKIEFRKGNKLRRQNEESPEYLKEEPESQLKTKIISELAQLRKAFNSETDYQKAIESIHNYFSNKRDDIQTVFVKNGNIKNLAFALGEIWRSQRNAVISLEYLQFYKKAFSVFSRQEIDVRNILASNLYKYSISKT